MESHITSGSLSSATANYFLIEPTDIMRRVGIPGLARQEGFNPKPFSVWRWRGVLELNAAVLLNRRLLNRVR